MFDAPDIEEIFWLFAACIAGILLVVSSVCNILIFTSSKVADVGVFSMYGTCLASLLSTILSPSSSFSASSNICWFPRCSCGWRANHFWSSLWDSLKFPLNRNCKFYIFYVAFEKKNNYDNDADLSNDVLMCFHH